jgi:cytidylate kinase
MTVIAMTREMGTRGKDVAARLAHELEIGVVHHELVEKHLAERLHLKESAVHRFLEGEASLWERWRIDSERLSRFSSEEILQLAMRGDILIRGWGAAQLLRDVSHVLCVRICAPMTVRVEEMKRRLGVDDTATVEREIRRNDDAHERAIQRQFQADWRDPTTYDITINTGHVPVDVAAGVLRQLVQSGAYEPTEESRLKLFDKLVVARVTTAMDQEFSHSPIGSGLRVMSEDGHVTIQGVVSSKGDHRKLLEQVREIEGVESISDNTVSLPVSHGV